ncbi:MAG TPA: radical SAM family heme chaperone HemW [Candidatus Sulfotelmatobacter sp.]|nr:radical SAM family heme chaperone HemW [Candidatus Sulfotelmatobacter sp.]
MTGGRPPVALYLHVPFCVSLCPYCDFVVYSGSAARGPANRIARFVEALLVELRLRADLQDAAHGPPGPARPPLASVYLGGGTPSLLAAGQVGALLRLIEQRFGLAADAEVTLEANPGGDELGDLAGFRAAGVTRLSLGAQSLQADELRRLGRRHRPADVGRAVERARGAGLRSVSLDLLYDVPGQTVESWSGTLDAAMALAPDHLSAYALTLDDPDAEGLTGPLGDHLPVRAGARHWRTAARAAQDADRAAELYERLDERMAAAGLPWYEVSNFAPPGERSRHNLAYWRRLPYEAVGPGAHAFDGGRLRRWNAARLDGYLGALLPASGAPPRLPPGGREVLDEATVTVEEAMLGLRLADGLAPSVAARAAVAPTIAWGREQGLVADGPAGHAVLTRRGRLLSNELFARLL